MANDIAIQSISFADSEIANITFGAGKVRILFAAAHVLRRNPENNDKPAEGYSRGVELVLMEAYFEVSTDDFMGRISSGSATVDGIRSLQLPLPCAMTGLITLELDFSNQSHFAAKATSLKCHFTGEPNFFESMAC